jgi:hypothetical protein
MTSPVRRKRPWVGLVAVVLALLFLGVLATRRNRTLGPGQTVRYDDFDFTVEQANRLDRGPTPDRAEDSDDYLVRLRIDNRARRVDFRFDGNRLVFVDLDGKAQPIRPAAERTASGERVTPRTVVLRAGESGTVDYLYALPRDRSNLRLRVTSGTVGDLLDWLLSGRTEFQLP